MINDMLLTLYGIHVDEKTILNQLKGFRSGNHFYFTMYTKNKEAIHMEQTILGQFLVERGYPHTAVPIKTLDGNWYMQEDEREMLLLGVDEWCDHHESHGKELATFHQVGRSYQYEPREISSYGGWKDLWIQKLTGFEEKIYLDAEGNPNQYHRFMIDVLPYIIGISENAIQYMQETEDESRFDDSDQGTITFNRYEGQMQQAILYATDLVYDHPARDLAAYIRYCLLQDDTSWARNVTQFIQDYQSIQPLSVFTLRLIYARLLFPIHFLDLLEQGFTRQNFATLYPSITYLMEFQSTYEKRLADIFRQMGLDRNTLHIPVVDWL